MPQTSTASTIAPAFVASTSPSQADDGRSWSKALTYPSSAALREVETPRPTVAKLNSSTESVNIQEPPRTFLDVVAAVIPSIGTLATVYTFPKVAVGLLAIGATIGAVQLGRALYSYFSADTSDERRDAFTTIAETISGVVRMISGARRSDV